MIHFRTKNTSPILTGSVPAAAIFRRPVTRRMYGAGAPYGCQAAGSVPVNRIVIPVTACRAKPAKSNFLCQLIVKNARGITPQRTIVTVKNCARCHLPVADTGPRRSGGRVPQTYGGGCNMQVLPGNPVILWSGTSEARTRKIPSMRSETAPPTGSAVFIGGAPMKGRAEALPLAYLE